MPKNDMPSARFTTPIATLVWPHVHAPDTKFVKDGDNARYKTEFTLTAEEAAPMIKQAKALISEARKSKITKAPPKAPHKENDDGTVTFSCHSYNAPALFDAAGTPIKPGTKVGGGTRAAVAGLMKVYEGFGATGVTLYLNALQIVDLKEFGGGSAESFGFNVTDGFRAGDEDAEEESFDDDDPFAADDADDADADF
jgi:hypothetical protein